MRPAPVPQMERGRRGTHALSEGPELGQVVRGGEHMGPAACEDVLPVHHDHRASPCLRNPTVRSTTSGSRITDRCPRPVVASNSAPGHALAISSPWAYGTS